MAYINITMCVLRRRERLREGAGALEEQGEQRGAENGAVQEVVHDPAAPAPDRVRRQARREAVEAPPLRLLGEEVEVPAEGKGPGRAVAPRVVPDARLRLCGVFFRLELPLLLVAHRLAQREEQEKAEADVIR